MLMMFSCTNLKLTVGEKQQLKCRKEFWNKCKFQLVHHHQVQEHQIKARGSRIQTSLTFKLFRNKLLSKYSLCQKLLFFEKTGLS